MKVEKIEVGPLGTNCYLIYCENKKEGIIVDPGYNGERILSKVDNCGVDIKYIVFTHVHFDHILAYFDIKERFPESQLIVGEKEVPALTDEDKNLIKLSRHTYPEIKCDIAVKDGDKIEFGNESFTVIETPGHTVGSISLYSEGVLVSGDTLFNYSIGRCDFPTGNLKDEINSIINILFKLPEETIVYPGHGATTNIGFEKVNNEVYAWI